MDVLINDEFMDICKAIVLENRTEDEWSEIESDDMFQSDSFCGGYDADERAFCFSYYDSARSEYWFQLTLSEVVDVANGVKTSIEVRTPD